MFLIANSRRLILIIIIIIVVVVVVVVVVIVDVIVVVFIITLVNMKTKFCARVLFYEVGQKTTVLNTSYFKNYILKLFAHLQD